MTVHRRDLLRSVIAAATSRPLAIETIVAEPVGNADNARRVIRRTRLRFKISTVSTVIPRDREASVLFRKIGTPHRPRPISRCADGAIG
jgi:hypothetical protein